MVFYTVKKKFLLSCRFHSTKSQAMQKVKLTVQPSAHQYADSNARLFAMGRPGPFAEVFARDVKHLGSRAVAFQVVPPPRSRSAYPASRLGRARDR